MRQLLYVSTAAAATGPRDIADILQSSRHNNALDGVTGLLWTDGKRFMQVIEGADDAIEDAYARISADTRHTNIDLIFDRTISEREFGDWSMASRGTGDQPDKFDLRVLQRLNAASPVVSSEFGNLVPAA